LTYTTLNLKRIYSSKALCILLAIGFGITLYNMKLWDGKKKLIEYDVISYYAYLPAYFIHDDLSLAFTKDPNFDREGTRYWPEKTQDGALIIKTTMGMAYLYTPFFLAGHTYAQLSEHKTNGFTVPYQVALVFSGYFFFLVGLYYLRKLLLMHFTDGVTFWSILTVVLGTNLVYYETVTPAMSHGYSFSLIAMFLYLSINWIKKPTLKRSICVGFLLGLITLIRPTNVLIVIVPLLYNVTNFSSLKARFGMVFQHWKLIIPIGLAALIVILPQLFYWKSITDHWLFFSYQGERFYFDRPRIINGLFSYRKGWLLYTPLIILSFVGIGISFKSKKALFLPSLMFFTLIIYVTFSWWCWWYGGGFSARPMIDFYALSALLFGVFFKWLFTKKKFVKLSTISLVIALIGLSVFQNLQAKYTTIHFDSMSKETYWSQFLILSRKPNHNATLVPPDYEAAKKGVDEYLFDPF